MEREGGRSKAPELRIPGAQRGQHRTAARYESRRRAPSGRLTRAGRVRRRPVKQLENPLDRVWIRECLRGLDDLSCLRSERPFGQRPQTALPWPVEARLNRDGPIASSPQTKAPVRHPLPAVAKVFVGSSAKFHFRHRVRGFWIRFFQSSAEVPASISKLSSPCWNRSTPPDSSSLRI